MKLALLFFVVIATTSAILCSDLKQDLQDILATIPLLEIKAIAREHAESDSEFQEVVNYMQGPEWNSIIDTVGANPSWQKFKVYMDNAGVDIDGIIQYFRDLVADVEISKCSDDVTARTLREFLDDIHKILDVSQTLTVFNDKLNNSPDFQEFFEIISSEEAYNMAEEIRALEEVQRVAERLTEMGIDIDKVIDLIYELLGWNNQTVTRDYRSEIQAIFSNMSLNQDDVTYNIEAENAAEFLEMVKYIQGDEFAAYAFKQRLSWQVCINILIISGCIGS
nr:protein G12-like [Onthophagus taurus]